MTLVGQIRKLHANGLTPDRIAAKCGVPKRRVQQHLWEDRNRERVREMKRKWVQSARKHARFKAHERAVQRDYDKNRRGRTEVGA